MGVSIAWGEVVVGLISGGSLAKGAQWLFSRRRGRIQFLEAQLVRSDERFERHELRMDKMDVRLSECQDHKDECEDALSTVRQEVAELMAKSGVATYTARTPRGNDA